VVFAQIADCVQAACETRIKLLETGASSFVNSDVASKVEAAYRYAPTIRATPAPAPNPLPPVDPYCPYG